MAIQLNQNALARRKEASVKLAQAKAEKQSAKSQSNNTSIALDNSSNTSDANFFSKAGQTLLDVVGNVASGVGKAIEGVVDAGATIVGEVGGWFDNDFKEQTSDFIKRDFTGEWIQNPLDDATQDSYLNDFKIGSVDVGGYVRETAQAVGQLLPNVVLTLVGANFLTMPTLIARSAGNSVEDALNDGADYERAMAYGAISGTVEALTEKISDKLFGKANIVDKVSYDTGKTAVKDALLDTSKAGFGKALQIITGNGEAIEEMVSEIVNPWIKQVYQADSIGDALSNGFNESFTQEQLKNVIHAGIVGATSYYAFLPVDKLNRTLIPSYDNSVKLNDIQTQIIEYNDTMSKLDKAVSEGKISTTDENYQKVINELNTLKQQINDKVGQLEFRGSEKTQTKSQAQLASMLSTNNSLGAKVVNGKVTVANQNQLNTVNSNYNQEAYSTSLKGSENNLKYKPTANQLTEAQKEGMKLNNKLSSAGHRAGAIVFTDDITVDTANGLYDNATGITYINTKSSDEQVRRIAVMHEFTHSLEGSKAYQKFAKYLRGELKNNEFLSKAGITSSSVNSMIENLITLLNNSKGKIDSRTLNNKLAYLQMLLKDNKMSVLDKYTAYVKENYLLKAGQDLSIEEVQSEVIAKYVSENLFTDEKTINRLCEKDLSLGKKILRWIQDKIHILKGNSKEEIKYRAFLKKAENLYKNAIERAIGLGIKETVDKEDETKYSVDNGVNDGERIGTSLDSNNRDRWNNISVSNDRERIRLLSGIGEKTKERIQKLNVERIYTNPETEIQENIKWHSDYEKLNIFFMNGLKSKVYVYDGKNIFVPENLTEQDFVDILNIVKPIQRIDGNKIAHISNERWVTYLRFNPKAFITRMPIQQFLDMSTDSYVTQRQINARSSSISNNPSDIKNTSGDYIYLKINVDTNEVVEHDGRHRLTNLLNSGYKFADVFIDLVGENTNFDIKELKNIKGQFNDKKYNLTVAKVNSENYKNNIDSIFKNPQDNGLSYSISDTDSQGNTLTEQQREFFNDSKVVDENGNLQVVYHGTTESGFTIFDKNKRKAYFTTNNLEVAKGYQQHRDYKNIYKGYLNLKNPLIIDGESKRWIHLPSKNIINSLNLSKQQLEKIYEKVFGEPRMLGTSPQDITLIALTANDLGYSNYDGVIINNVYDDLQYDKRNLGNDYIFFNSNQFKNIDNTNPTEDADIRYSIKDDGNGNFTDENGNKVEGEDLINNSISMEECKKMIELAYKIVNPNQYEDDVVYKNAEDWLEKAGVDDVAMYIDNEYEVQEKYINKIKPMYYGLITTEEILEAYLNKSLVGGNNKSKPVRLDISKSNNYKDSRVYAPRIIENAKEKWQIANQKLTSSNKDTVNQARADILMFAHNSNAVDELGISQKELNQKLRQWSNYSERARSLSQHINKNVAIENMWTGIENSSYLSQATVSKEQLNNLVNKIYGESNEYERNYIMTTMLALDTHIDYKHLSFRFNATDLDKNVMGEYSNSKLEIAIKNHSQNTVAHEIGHAIDYKWQGDVYNKEVGTDALSRGVNFDLIKDEETKQWVRNFNSFIDDLTDVNDTYSSYTRDRSEVFARFVAKFVEWTRTIATGRNTHLESSWYSDKFTAQNYYDFIKILQEKAKLDSKTNAKKTVDNVSFSITDEDIETDSLGELDKWLDSLSTKEFMELLSDTLNDKVEVNIPKTLTKNERREAYIKKLYETGNLNKLVTKIVENNPAMQKYFKDTQMNRKYDPLAFNKTNEYVVMFHGTPKKDFYSFDSNKIGLNGTAMGSGFYFTEALEYAEDYTKDYMSTDGDKTGKVMSVLLDIKKPLSRSKHEISKLELRKFISSLKNNGEYIIKGTVGSASLLDGYNNAMDKTLNKLFDMYSNDANLIEELYDMGKMYMDFDEFHNKLTEQLGYDGIIAWGKAEGTQAIVFKSNQIKDIFNYKPTESSDIRYSVDDDDWIDEALAEYQKQETEVTDVKVKGENADLVKARAKLNQEKYYNKSDIEKVIKDTINQDNEIRVTPAIRDKAIDSLFEKMNNQSENEQRKTATEIADFIINNALYENTELRNVIDTINEYKGKKIKLSDKVKSDIKYRFDKESWKVILEWNNKDGLAIDSLGAELNQKLDGVLDLETSERDLFMQVYDLYNNAKDELKTLAKNKLSEEQIKADKEQLINDILKAYETKGNITPTEKLKTTYKATIAKLRQDLRDTKLYSNAFVDFMHVNKIAKEVVRKGYSASHLENDIVKGFLKEVASAGNIKTVAKNARERMKALKEIYTLSGEKSLFRALQESQQEEYDIFGQQNNYYDMNLADMIAEIADGEGELSATELNLLTKITQGMLYLYQNFDKTFKDGKYQETTELAEKYTQSLQKHVEERKKVKTVGFLWKGKELYDAHSVFRNMDSYDVKYNKELGINEDVGFFSEFYKDITDGEVKAKVAEIELLEPFGKFYKEHKGFEKRLTNDTIKLELDKPITTSATSEKHIKVNVNVPLGEAISIYLTSLRPQSNFENTTITLKNKNGTQDTYKMTIEQVEEMFKGFDENTKAYIKLVQKFFNEDATKLKVETDMQMWGYTNIESGGNYFPINREASTLAKKLGDASLATDAFNVYNASFNKTTKPGAKQSLFIGNVYSIVEKHAWGVSAYYGLYAPLKAFNQVYNKRIGVNYKTSIRQETKSNFVGATEYIDKLLKDIQGISSKTGFSKVFQTLRGNYAKYQLGLNPKTVLGQTSSYLMAQTYLDVSSLAKGLTMKANTEQMYKYAPFTKYRMVEKDAVKAQTNTLDKLNNGLAGKIGEALTAPIGFMDNATVKKLWNACQAQVEKNAGFKIGTEENLNASGKLLEKVVRETQSNSITSEKTGLARTQNEIVSALTMFTSDAQKQLSRLVDGIGTNAVIKSKIKSGELSKDSMEAKVGKKLLAKSATGFVTATTLYVLIGMLMRWLLGKRDEDESLGEEFLGDFTSQVVGLLPIVNQFYGYFSDGYEFNIYAIGMVNDLLSATKTMSSMISKLAKGEQLTKSDIIAPLRQSVYGIGEILGLPTRNLYNYVYGIVGKFSPSTAYKMNSLFYDASSSDLDTAIENNDTKLAETIMQELYGTKNLDIDSKYAKELIALYKEGYSVIPSKIGDSFTYNEMLYELSGTQQKKLIQVANSALATNNEIINSKLYASLSSSAKASYLKANYNINYINAIAEIVGVDNLKDSDAKKYLFVKAFKSDSKLINYMAYISSIESDVDENGKAVSNSRKQKIQKYINSLKLSSAEKYLLMSYAGYKNTYGKAQVKSYLSKSGLSKTEIETVMSYCGY